MSSILNKNSLQKLLKITHALDSLTLTLNKCIDHAKHINIPQDFEAEDDRHALKIIEFSELRGIKHSLSVVYSYT